MKKYMIILLLGFCAGGMTSCKYLDIVPDDIATIDNAFTLRENAKKYLYTCYSYLPSAGSVANSPSLLRGEIWPLGYYKENSTYFVEDGQNVVDPLMNFWEGRRGGNDLFEAIRDCNIFLDNIYNVPDMEKEEKDQWAAEVKFLKAYYTFYLIRCYGPIPLIRKNLPIDASINKVRVKRQPVDSCFNYVVQLLNEAIPDLPSQPIQQIDRQKYGRINRPIAVSVKALVLVTAASPLCNGNTDYANYTDPEYGPLFNQTYSEEKWKKAMIASKQAIDECEGVGYKLYKYQEGEAEHLSDTTITKLSLREAFADRDPNGEVIWPYTAGFALQSALTPRTWDPSPDGNAPGMYGSYGPSIDVAELFYTNHGLPIDQDKDWNYAGRFDLDTAKEANKYNIDKGYVTAALHFNREPRFYASTGFDGGIWYGQGKYDDNDSWHLEGRAKGYTSVHTTDYYSPTGYWPKKLINYQNYVESKAYYVTSYLFPVIRLAGVYLLYAEAANEYKGPTDSVFYYLNAIRERAGIPDVKTSWDQYSNDAGKYGTKEGMREIIRKERQIELIYESKRYWDLLRWKTAEKVLNKPVQGWNLKEESAEGYYQPTLIYQRQFKKRDYFIPIREHELQRDANLLQSPKW